MKASLLVCVAVSLLSSPVHAREVGDVEIDERIAVADRELTLNGAALYEATFLQIDIFAIALYLEAPTKWVKKISSCERPMTVRIHWLYEASRDDLYDRWRTTMRSNAGRDLAKLEARIDQMVTTLRAVEEGEVWQFDYTPDAGLVMSMAGVPITTLTGKDFCQLWIDGYVGKPADANIRKHLLAGK